MVGDDGRLSWIMDAFTTSDTLSLLQPITRLGDDLHQLHAQQRQGGHRRLRRHHDLLRLRHQRSHPRRLSPHLSQPVQGCRGDARRSAQARPLSRVAAQAAGGGLRPLSHDRSGGLLQPRGSVDRRHRSRHERGRRTNHAADAAELRADEAARTKPASSSSRFCPSRPPIATT